jgi:hypothetical protein
MVDLHDPRQMMRQIFRHTLNRRVDKDCLRGFSILYLSGVDIALLLVFPMLDHFTGHGCQRLESPRILAINGIKVRRRYTFS